MKEQLSILSEEAVALLQQLIAIPSFSKEEEGTANLLHDFLSKKKIPVQREKNNIWAKNKYFDPAKRTLLLNSHHDTVKPNKGYTRDPFEPAMVDGKLFGLGSNDAGGPLVSLIATFLHFYAKTGLAWNIVFAASAEEEISGRDGIELVIPVLGPVDCAIVGEPTLMNLAVAEKGLLVLDCTAYGKAGHAAREEGENALYRALPDIEWFRNFHFPKVSDLLGPVKMSVTVIETDNKAHNVVPASCRWVVDVRVNELYSFEEILQIIRPAVCCEVAPRSLRMRSSMIPLNNPLVTAGLELGKSCYGSPTTSDKALMPFPALKMGPGDSARSHTADEFIYLDEIKQGIELYIRLTEQLLTPTPNYEDLE